MSRHFTSTGFLPEGTLTNRAGETVCFANLPPFLRVLLSTDGTVTKSLESYFWEPVAVENLGQAEARLEHDVPDIGCVAGDPVLRRRVQLVGRQSQRRFALAESLIRTAILPDKLKRDLEAGLVGIGELLRECNLETYREIIDFGYGDENPGDTVWRCYRIAMAGEPFIRITEQFPVGLYAGPPAAERSADDGEREPR